MSTIPAILTPSLPMREWALIHTELQWIYDHEVLPVYRNRVTDKMHNGYWAWYVRKGMVQVTTVSGHLHRAKAGQWLLVPSEKLRQEFSVGAQILSLHFLCQWPSGENIFTGGGGVVNGEAQPSLERRAVQLERMVRKHIPDADTRYYSCFSDYELFLTFHTLFMQWLAVWFRIQKELGAGLTRLTAGDDRLLRAVRCLNNAPLDKGLPHETIARESGLGEAHLNRLFLSEYGMTISKRWEQRRLNHAKSCLETSRMRVKEIAYSLGFKSDSHFMLWFKQRTKLRPNEYRATHRKLIG